MKCEYLQQLNLRIYEMTQLRTQDYDPFPKHKMCTKARIQNIIQVVKSKLKLRYRSCRCGKFNARVDTQKVWLQLAKNRTENGHRCFSLRLNPGIFSLCTEFWFQCLANKVENTINRRYECLTAALLSVFPTKPKCICTTKICIPTYIFSLP